MKTINKKLAELVPYEKNAKKHGETQIANVAESIKQYGFVQPIVIDKNGVIVIGHCRALAAKKLGLEEVPCVCVDELTPEQVNALRIVDNKSNESEWDFDLLAEELPEIDLSDFEFDFGFSMDEEEYIEEKAEEAEELPTDKLPESRIFVFSVSAFGTKSECFVQAKLSEEEVEKFLQRFAEVGASTTAERLREALNGL